MTVSDVIHLFSQLPDDPSVSAREGAEDSRVMNEKCLASIPPLRVPDTFKADLIVAAARNDRTLSDYIRHVLSKELYGVIGSVAMQPILRNEKAA